MTFFQHIIYSSFLIVMQLHYDHMVLVDYLISKDVGVHCAQYLLRLVAILDFKYLLNWNFWPLLYTYGHRCLRLVSQSWHAFVDDSSYLTKIEQLLLDKSFCKRQRISRDVSSARASSSKEYKNGSGCDKEVKNSHKLFLDAKVCLYSLKRTVEDLQKKGLFPYNPKALLRRFVICPCFFFCLCCLLLCWAFILLLILSGIC
jgi:hypothetical protein